ncbi:MAG: class II aldolase/adducin family protein [Candidatus Omnitrophica bacterium]|nr:class II aldolase/adducin family protein [Candidatus Omnitrophota bacterium]
MEEQIIRLKKDIIAIGRLMWEKELASGLNGNISAKLNDEHILLTATKTCLGLLGEKDILLMKADGEILDDGKASTETLMHTAIYKSYPEAKAIIHTHTPYTNAYFLENDELLPRIFETKMYLGQVQAVPQETPAVTDTQPIINALKNNNIMVLKRHGVLAMGSDLFDCFLFLQSLEEAVKIDFISRFYKADKSTSEKPVEKKLKKPGRKKKYELFSQEQIEEIVRLVNADKTLKELGSKSNMTMDLAVRLNENGKLFCFRFDKGKIVEVTKNENAEFLISADEKVWRSVFNREIDPFVATTQKKMELRGDFAKISKWYAPCSRIFELWQSVPVD